MDGTRRTFGRKCDLDPEFLAGPETGGIDGMLGDVEIDWVFPPASGRTATVATRSPSGPSGAFPHPESGSRAVCCRLLLIRPETQHCRGPDGISAVGCGAGDVAWKFSLLRGRKRAVATVDPKLQAQVAAAHGQRRIECGCARPDARANPALVEGGVLPAIMHTRISWTASSKTEAVAKPILPIFIGPPVLFPCGPAGAGASFQGPSLRRGRERRAR